MCLGQAEALRYSGKAAEALAVLDRLSGAIEQTAEYLSQRAPRCGLGGNPRKSSPFTNAPWNPTAIIPGPCSAWPWKTIATATTKRPWNCTSGPWADFPPTSARCSTWALLYEDREQYDRAAQCYQRVLDVYPDHPRARLFFKDTEASHEQYYDEDAQKKRDRMSQVLGIPVTDFELSVRSRNCLQKMGIMTLGDLCRCTEQDLWPARTSAKPVSPRSRKCWPPRGCGWASSPPTSMTDRDLRARNALRRRTGHVGQPISDLNLSVRAASA